MVVEHLREPLAVEHAVLVLGLRLRGHEEVAIVIVPDVLLVQPWQLRQRPLLRVRVSHVPVGDEVVAIRVRMDEQDDDVVQDAHCLVIAPADHVEHHLAELLRADRFRGVQAPVDPHNGLALLRQSPRLFVRESLCMGESRRDVLIVREPLVVGGRRHDGHEVRPPFRRPADLLHHHAVGFPVECAPVRGELGIAREEVVVAEVRAECLPGRRDVCLCVDLRGHDRRKTERGEEYLAVQSRDRRHGAT